MDVFTLLNKTLHESNLLTFEATVPTGFESVAMSEVQQKLHVDLDNGCKSRGRIFFNTPYNNWHIVMKLRSIDKVHLLSKGFQNLKFTGIMDTDIMTIKLLSTCVNWQKTISVWDRVNSFTGIKYPSMAEYIVAKEIEIKIKALSESFRDSGLSSQILDDLANKACAMDLNYDNVQIEMKKLQQSNLSLVQPECPNSSTVNKTQKKLELKEKNALEKIMYNKLDKRKEEEKVLKYRVTCLRKGDHCFGSQDAAHHFGGELQDQYNWVVDLSHYDLNILLCIMRDELYCGVTLTKESLHHRNITHFGPTTLRATVCYGMIRLGCPNLGDIIVDPLGGGGSLSIEGVLTFPLTFHLCGDIHPKAVMRTKANISSMEGQQRSKINTLTWDATKLPLRDGVVDLFISDLPFGKRCGSKKGNPHLYTNVVREMARTAVPGTGRAVLLTHDTRSFCKAFRNNPGLWVYTSVVNVNIGGLDACVYVMQRTIEEVK